MAWARPALTHAFPSLGKAGLPRSLLEHRQGAGRVSEQTGGVAQQQRNSL